MPIIYFTAAWVAGMVAIWLLPNNQEVGTGLLLLTALAAGFVFFRKKREYLLLTLAILLGGALGAARYYWFASYRQGATFLGTYNDLQNAEKQPQFVNIEGIVVTEPEERDTYTGLRIKPTLLLVEGERKPVQTGLVLVRANRTEGIAFGDKIRIGGYLVTPNSSEDFDYAEFLRRQGVYSQLQNGRASLANDASRYDKDFNAEIEACAKINQQVRALAPAWGGSTWQSIQQTLDPIGCGVFALQRRLLEYKVGLLASQKRLFPEPESAYLRAVVLGVRSDLPKDVQRAFEITGTSHMISISGYHISAIAAILLAFMRFLFGGKEKPARLPTILVIFIYVVLVGAPSAAVRSAIMGGLVIGMGGLKVRNSGLLALTIAVLSMTIFWPDYLFQLSFQLSVLATLGLVLYSNKLSDFFIEKSSQLLGERLGKPLGTVILSPMAVTLAAQLVTLPLIMSVFGRISLISPLANFIINPAQPPLLMGGFLVTALAHYWQQAGEILAWGIWPFLRFTINAVRWLAKTPGALIYTGRATTLFSLGYYLLLAGVTIMTSTTAEERPAWLRKIASDWLIATLTFGFALLGLVGWLAYSNRPDGNLHVYFLDVGQGDAALLQTPQGEHILINGGASANRLANQLGQSIPYGTRSLHQVFLTNPSADSLTGLTAVLGRYDIGELVVAIDPTTLKFPANLSYEELLTQQQALGTPIIFIESQQSFSPEENLYLQVVRTSDKGALLDVRYKNASFVFAAPLSRAEVDGALLSGLFTPSTVLQVPSYAAPDAFTADLWQASQPLLSVISVGAGNSIGAPGTDQLRVLRQSNLLRTDQNGWIHLSTDGTQLWVKVARSASDKRE